MFKTPYKTDISNALYSIWPRIDQPSKLPTESDRPKHKH